MKFVFHILLMFLVFMPFSAVKAQENMSMAQDPKVVSAASAEKLAEEKPAPEKQASLLAGDKKVDPLDPVSGTVPLSDVPFYDVYERQIRYKKADKEFRQSLEDRRVAFIEPETSSREAAKQKIQKIYQEEANAKAPPFQRVPPPALKTSAGWKMADDNIEDEPEDTRPIVPVGQPGDGMNVAPEAVVTKKEDVAKETDGQKVEKVVPDAVPAPTPEQVKTTTPAPSAPPVVTTPPAANQATPDVKPPTEVAKPPVKEIPIETTPKDDEASKKVVVPADAPDFEKSPFE
jgi:hypothetical protein